MLITNPQEVTSVAAAELFSGPASDAGVLSARNQEVQAVLPDWKNIDILVNKDKSKYDNADFMFQMPNENESERKKRSKHFKRGFINFTQNILEDKAEYVMRKEVLRTSEQEELQAFWETADRSGQSITEFMKNQTIPSLCAFGTVFGVVDKPDIVFDNKQQEKEYGLPYLYIINPLDVLNFEWGDDGQMLWFRYKCLEIPGKRLPFEEPSKPKTYYKTWTRDAYYKHDERGTLVDSFDHRLGVVPVVVQSMFVIDSTRTLGQSTFFTTADYIIMANNLNSGVNNELFKMFNSILMGQTEDIGGNLSGQMRDPQTSELELTRSTTSDSKTMPVNDMGKKPEYLIKDTKHITEGRTQAQQYFELAIENEASTKSVSWNDSSAQSGVAKAYDFDEANAMLAGVAENAESFEKQVAELVCRWLAVENDSVIRYDRNFDVRSFSDKLSQVKEMIAVKFPSPTGIKEAYKAIAKDITSDGATLDKINLEIDNSTQEQENETDRNGDDADGDMGGGESGGERNGYPEVRNLREVLTDDRTGNNGSAAGS